MTVSISIAVVVLLLALLYWNRLVLETSVFDPPNSALPSQAVVDQLFSREDFAYSKTLPKRIQAMFMRDRRALALIWIRQIRHTILRLTREHANAVRRSANLQLWKEVRIAVNFGLLLASCELFILVLATLGPIRSKLLISSLAARMQYLQAQLGGSYLSAYGAA